jgi:hypothetical protein
MSTTPTPVPPAPAPPPEPEKKSGLVWWILGVFLAGAVLLGLAGMFATSFFLREIVHVREAAGQVEIQTPAGSVKVDPHAGEDPGLPVYPGALVGEAGASVEVTGPTDEAMRITAAHYRTSDPLEKVDEWYQQKLGPEFRREGPGVMNRKKEIFGISVKSSDIAFISDADDLLRVVVIERKALSTHIALARIGQAETQ